MPDRETARIESCNTNLRFFCTLRHTSANLNEEPSTQPYAALTFIVVGRICVKGTRTAARASLAVLAFNMVPCRLRWNSVGYSAGYSAGTKAPHNKVLHFYEVH